MRILVTGATGFIGRVACEAAGAQGFTVRRTLRTPAPTSPVAEDVVVGEIGGGTDWSRALVGVDTVIHLAARAHVMREGDVAAASRYRDVNGAGTRRLAEAAARAGVRRVVFVSSVKVNGERTFDRAFDEEDPPAPADDYARSKLLAEEALAEVGRMTGLEWVVIRPPLVHGPGVKGNLRRLLHWVDRGRPLPFGSLENRRSLIGVENLVDLLLRALVHPAAAGSTFLAADEGVLSTPDLVRLMARGLNRPCRLVRMPLSWLEGPLRAVGVGRVVDRLVGSLEVSNDRVRHDLGWRPPVSLEDGILRMAQWYRRDVSP